MSSDYEYDSDDGDYDDDEDMFDGTQDYGKCSRSLPPNHTLSSL